MGKYYSQYRRPPRPERRWKVHPVWRGIGCIMMIIIPIVSWAIASLFVDANKAGRWLDVPAGLDAPAGVDIPFLTTDLIVTALVALVVAVLLFGAYTIFYMLIYRVTGPPSRGPQDAPPQKHRRARKTHSGL